MHLTKQDKHTDQDVAGPLEGQQQQHQHTQGYPVRLEQQQQLSEQKLLCEEDQQEQGCKRCAADEQQQQQPQQCGPQQDGEQPQKQQLTAQEEHEAPASPAASSADHAAAACNGSQVAAVPAGLDASAAVAEAGQAVTASPPVAAIGSACYGPGHCAVLLEGGDLLLLGGEARYGWAHGIEAEKEEVMLQAGGCENGAQKAMVSSEGSIAIGMEVIATGAAGGQGPEVNGRGPLESGKEQQANKREQLASQDNIGAWHVQASSDSCNGVPDVRVEDHVADVKDVGTIQAPGVEYRDGIVRVVRGLRVSITLRALVDGIQLTEH